MPSLQEALAVLLGAESEGAREVEEAKAEAERIKRATNEKIVMERQRRLNGAKEKAKAIIESARSAAEEEAKQILEVGKMERQRARRRFNEVVESVVDSLVKEHVANILKSKEREI